VLAERGHLYVVADGIGGQSAGATASLLAVENVQREYYHGPFSDVPTALARAIEVANQAIQDKAQEPGFARMGTTLVAAVVRGAELTAAHVGDSRAYLASQTGIHQLTEDHTWVAEQQRAGVLTEEEARQHSQRHIISRSLGKAGAVPDITQGPLQPGDAVLLCTDGLSNPVSAQEMHQLLVNRPPQTAADQLVGLANQRGGPDNVTALVVQVGRAPAVAPPAGGAGGALRRLSKRLAELPPKQMAMAVAVASMAVCLMTAGVVSLLRMPLGPARTGRPAAPTSKPTGWIPPSEGQATDRPSPTVEGQTDASRATTQPVPTSTLRPTATPAPSNIGVIVPHEGQGGGTFLLRDPYRKGSGIIWLGNGSEVEILDDSVEGYEHYESTLWYQIRCVVKGETHTGYVPATVVQRQTSTGGVQ